MAYFGIKSFMKPKPGVMLNPTHPLSRGLVAAWLFNDGAGSKTFDNSLHKNHGLITGADWIPSGLNFIAANLDHVDVPYSPSLKVGTGDYTYVAKFYPHIVVNSAVLLNGRAFAGGKRTTMEVSETKLGTTIDDDIAPMFVDGNTTLNVNTWYTGATMREGDFIKIFLNGVLDNTPPAGANNLNPDSDKSLTIGIRKRQADDNLDGAFDGYIKYIFMYARALSAFEIKWLHYRPYDMFLPMISQAGLYVAPPVSVIMNQFQCANLGADLFNGGLL